MSENRFTIKYRYAEMLAATWLTFRKRWMWGGTAKYILAVSLLMFVLMEASAEHHGGIETIANAVTGVAFSVVCLIITMIYWLWCIPRSVKKSYDQLALDGTDIEFSYDDDHLKIADATNTVNLPWTRWIKWAENEQFLLLYRTDAFAHFVPNTQVDPKHIADLKRHLAGAAVRKF